MERSFLCCSAACGSYVVKYTSHSFPHILIGLFSSLWADNSCCIPVLCGVYYLLIFFLMCISSWDPIKKFFHRVKCFSYKKKKCVWKAEGQRQILQLLVHFASAHCWLLSPDVQGWAEQKPGAQPKLSLYHMGIRDTGTSAVPWCLPRCVLSGHWDQKQSQNLDPGTPLWDPGIPGDTLTTGPVLSPCFDFEAQVIFSLLHSAFLVKSQNSSASGSTHCFLKALNLTSM